MSKKKPNYKTLSVYFNNDDEIDMMILQAIEDAPKVGTNKSGLVKQILYQTLILDKENYCNNKNKEVNKNEVSEDKSVKNFVENFKNKIN